MTVNLDGPDAGWHKHLGQLGQLLAAGPGVPAATMRPGSASRMPGATATADSGRPAPDPDRRMPAAVVRP